MRWAFDNALKVVVGVFVVFYVQVTWSSWGGPVFLYVCSLGLQILFVALLFENRFLASLALVGAAPMQALWSGDLLSGLLLGSTPLNVSDTVLADPEAIIRFRSFYHLWAPLLALYLVVRSGYDARARNAALTLAVPVLLLSAWVKASPASRVTANLNFVEGPEGVPPAVWLLAVWTVYASVTVLADWFLVRSSLVRVTGREQILEMPTRRSKGHCREGRPEAILGARLRARERKS